MRPPTPDQSVAARSGKTIESDVSVHRPGAPARQWGVGFAKPNDRDGRPRPSSIRRVEYFLREIVMRWQTLELERGRRFFLGRKAEEPHPR